jgi:hypothetical protein
VFRLLAWSFHDADLALNSIIVELVVTAVLLAASSRLPQRK